MPPELFPENETVFEAFVDLDADRPEGFSSLRHIPINAILKYAEMMDWNGRELFRRIRGADLKWVEACNKGKGKPRGPPDSQGPEQHRSAGG